MGPVHSVEDTSTTSTSAMNSSGSDVPKPTRRSKGVPVVNGRPKGKVDFLDLPLETQKQIVGHVSLSHLLPQHDLTIMC